MKLTREMISDLVEMQSDIEEMRDDLEAKLNDVCEKVSDMGELLETEYNSKSEEWKNSLEGKLAKEFVDKFTSFESSPCYDQACDIEQALEDLPRKQEMIPPPGEVSEHIRFLASETCLKFQEKDFGAVSALLTDIRKAAKDLQRFLDLD